MDTPERYLKRIKRIHRRLGISKRYEVEYGLPLQYEASNLADIENDIFGRPQRLTPDAAKRWMQMKNAAANDGVAIAIVSAFRSVDYQTALIERKIQQGHSLAAILSVNAAPGYSEHHTGNAIDLTTLGCDPLTEAFERTPAFAWLIDNALDFGFKLSYPKSASNALTYEPWHWACMV